MRYCLLFLLPILFYSQIQGQNRCTVPPLRQTDNWLFGDRAALLFNDASVQSSTINNVFTAPKGCSSISDVDGNLLLFTDGLRVFNAAYQQLSTGAGLAGNPGSTQSSVIVPRPGNSTRYFIFTVDLYIPSAIPPIDKGFRYTEVDISGTGYVVSGSKDILLQSKVAEKVSAVKHSNGIDFWVVTHDLNTNEFYSYLVDAGGVSSSPVISAVGSSHNGEDHTNRNAQGAIKISPDGTLLALAIGGQRKIEIFTFNPSSGSVSSPATINSPDPVSENMTYGIEFSSDSRFLYFTTFNVTFYNSNKLYQVDLQATIFNPVLLNPAPFDQDVASLQLGRDGRIYVGHHSRASLGCIQNPKRPGIACTYDEVAIDLQGRLCRLGLPNFVTSFLNTPHFYFDPTCYQEATVFSLVNNSNISTITWNFGDPAGTTDLSDLFNPTHVFSNPGTYTVSVTENGIYTYSQQVTVKPLPFPIPSLPPLDSTFYLYPGSVLSIDGGSEYYSYQWFDLQGGGSAPLGNQQIQTIDSEGRFMLEVEDSLCCVGYRTFRVLSLDLILPNAFTPERNPNIVFRATGGSNVFNFNMRIYNRWGQLMFEEFRAEGVGEGWYGTLNGNPCLQGVYTYILTFDVEYQSAMKQIVKRGTVMLIR